ncbi:NAD(P)-binding protein [Penicillium lividum]|nr:NAD(P)-binding protein [Penicillium lividum]
MSTYKIERHELVALASKTVIITGGASGIGRATVELAHEHGANIVLGDWDEINGKALEAKLAERVTFVKTDVSSWQDVLALFQTTHRKYGIIHAVISNAGINAENLFDENTTREGDPSVPDLKSIDVNLKGHIYVTRCAAHFFAKSKETKCQLVMTGSAASFLDTPPLHLYCAAKAGVLGFMRSLRSQLIKDNITVNMVAPWMTVTPMLLPSFIDVWRELPANTSEGVAMALLLPIVQLDLNGKSLFVAGNEIIDFEDTLHEAQPLWMGKELSANVDEGQRRLVP